MNAALRRRQAIQERHRRLLYARFVEVGVGWDYSDLTIDPLTGITPYEPGIASRMANERMRRDRTQDLIECALFFAFAVALFFASHWVMA